VSTGKRVDRAVLLYRFGAYEVDTTRNELRKFGARIRLEPKPWQLLVALLERAGSVVTRNDLQQELWGADLFVEFDKGLNVAVAKVRAALSDLPEKSRYIETVPGQGYRFAADVERVFGTSMASESAEALRDQQPAPSSEDYPSQPDPERQGFISAGVRRPWLRRRGGAFVVAVTVCMVLLAVTVTKLTLRRPRAQGWVHDEKIMLVVLPFQNLSGDPDQEYLSDGMTEELSARLGNLNPQQLGVIGRTSAMVYKRVPRPISQIGKELSVGYVLEGSVRRNEGMLRVTAQLVKVSDQTHVWAETYDRSMRDLYQVEDEVAADIAKQVGISMALGKSTRSTSHSPDPEAHEAYLLGRYHWNKRTPAGWATGEKYFRLAIEKDPQYAAAYAGLAECRIPKQEAQAAARKSVELDPISGEAHTALGWVELYKNLDLAAAQDALKRAVQLDPNYAPAHHTYSAFLQITGRLQEAIIEENRAVRLDPLSHISRASLAELLSVAGQNDRGVEQLNLIFAMDSRFPKAHEVLGVIYLRRGMYKDAIREYQASEQYGGAKLSGLLGYAYARSGNKKEALRTLSELQMLEKSSGSGDASYDLAVIEIGLGNRAEALAWLEKEYQQHDDDGLLFLKFEPIFDPLRSDPRFQELLHRMNFPL
jgi:TolB-like protein/DNA-binding winged helix-turn-helix (wHTH) protein/Flp pilus assembly protein TadD